jgi:ribosomal-protein-alanine N-acetyltransferase
MGELHFRAATRDDIAQVLANEVAAYQVPWGKQALMDSLQTQYQFWLAVFESRIIGHLIFQSVLDESHLLNICIHPRHQGHGWGKQLIAFWLEQCRKQSIQRLFLEVRVSNEKAINLYQKYGFKRISRRKNYYPLPGNQREDGLVMMLEHDI